MCCVYRCKAVLNSEKGIQAFDKIQNEFLKFDISIEDIQKKNPFINGHCKLSRRRKQFFRNLDCENIETNMQKCIKPTLLEWIKEVVSYKLS